MIAVTWRQPTEADRKELLQVLNGSPDTWPLHPFLPVKRKLEGTHTRLEDLDTGVILDQRRYEGPRNRESFNPHNLHCTVFRIGVWALFEKIDFGEVGDGVEGLLDAFPWIQYDSQIAMMDDGWILD